MSSSKGFLGWNCHHILRFFSYQINTYYCNEFCEILAVFVTMKILQCSALQRSRGQSPDPSTARFRGSHHTWTETSAPLDPECFGCQGVYVPGRTGCRYLCRWQVCRWVRDFFRQRLSQDLRHGRWPFHAARHEDKTHLSIPSMTKSHRSVSVSVNVFLYQHHTTQFTHRFILEYEILLKYYHWN